MLTERRELLLAGLGGQGVILAGLLLGQAAVADGLYAAGANSYGAQARGSTCQAGLVLAPEAIDYPHVRAPHLLVAMSQGAYDALAGQMAPGGRILYDAGLVSPAGRAGELGLAVTETARKELGNSQAANVLWVGVVAGCTGWFSQESLARAVAENLPDRFLEVNQKALTRGWRMGRQLAESL